MMPSPSAVQRSLVAAVRAHFGLNQPDLARYLGISPMQVNYLEAGRRGLSLAVLAVLGPLADHVPPAGTPRPALTAADFGTPDRAPLEARLDYCQHHAARLRRELRPLEAQATAARHWRAAVPAIQATLPPDPGGSEPPALPPGPARRVAFRTWFRWRWLALRPTTLPPDLSTRYHLRRLQAEALETEAAALAALLL